MSDNRREPQTTRTVGTRAASDLVGVVLLTGAFAVLALSIGTVILADATDRVDRQGPLADIEVNVTDSRVNLTHSGGAELDNEDLTVFLRSGRSEEEYSVTASDIEGDSDDTFDPGEVYSHSHGFSTDTVRVVVAYGDNDVLVSEEVDVGGPG